MSYIYLRCDHCDEENDVHVDDIYDDFLSEVNKRQLAEDLVEDGWIDEEEALSTVRNYKDQEFNSALIKLAQNRIQLTKEEEDLILKMANKFSV